MPSCLARRREAARRSFGLTLASLAGQEASMAVCTCDYIDLPTNVALTNPGFVRLVNEANFGLKIATTSLGITASGTDTTLRLVVAAGGHVGIGTAAPVAALDVNHSAFPQLVVRGSSPAGLRVFPGTGGNTTSIEAFATTDPSLAAGYSRLRLTVDGTTAALIADASLAAAMPLSLQVGGAERLRISTTGTVGIGTVSPTQKLHVVGGVSGLTLQVEATNAGATDTALDIKTVEREYKLGQNVDSLGVGKLLVYDITAGVARLTVDTTGYVGIGTTAPGYPLDVAGTVRCTGVLLGGDMLMFGALKNSAGTRTNVDQTGCYFAD